MLDIAVDGQHQAVAVLGVVILLVFIQHVFAPGVLFRHHQARRALQLVVELGLDAVQALVVAADKADDLAGQGAKGVIALAVGHQIDAADLVFINKFTHLVGLLLLHFLANDLVIGLHLIFLAADILLVHAQDLRQGLSDQVLVAFVLGDLVGGDENGLGRGGNGQGLAVGVVDRAAGGRDGGGAGLLGHGFLLQLVVADDLQVIQPAGQGCKCGDAQRGGQQQRALLEDLRRYPDGALPFCFLAIAMCCQWSILP